MRWRRVGLVEARTPSPWFVGSVMPFGCVVPHGEDQTMDGDDPEHPGRTEQPSSDDVSEPVMADQTREEPHRRGIPEGEDDTEDPQPPPSGHDQQQVYASPARTVALNVPRGKDALTSKGGNGERLGEGGSPAGDVRRR